MALTGESMGPGSSYITTKSLIDADGSTLSCPSQSSRKGELWTPDGDADDFSRQLTADELPGRVRLICFFFSFVIYTAPSKGRPAPPPPRALNFPCRL